MTGILSRFQSYFTIVLLSGVAVVAASSTAAAQQVEAKAKVIKVVESGAFIDVQFTVTVSNRDSAVASNVFVIFKDGLQVGLGDVAPGTSAVSATQSESIDVASMPTRHVPVPVTVKFVFKGQNVEQSQTLVVDRPAPPAVQ
jgi:hypothetical protein